MAASDYQRAAQKRYRDKRKRDPEVIDAARIHNAYGDL